MNEQLIKFIELCLVDGVISDKEREVIFRKSKELGVPDDECEIILEGMIGKMNSDKKNESISNESLLSEFEENKIDLLDSEGNSPEIIRKLYNDIFDNKINKIKNEILKYESKKEKFSSQFQKSKNEYLNENKLKNKYENELNEINSENYFEKIFNDKLKLIFSSYFNERNNIWYSEGGNIVISENNLIVYKSSKKLFKSIKSSEKVKLNINQINYVSSNVNRYFLDKSEVILLRKLDDEINKLKNEIKDSIINKEKELIENQKDLDKDKISKLKTEINKIDWELKSIVSQISHKNKKIERIKKIKEDNFYFELFSLLFNDSPLIFQSPVFNSYLINTKISNDKQILNLTRLNEYLIDLESDYSKLVKNTFDLFDKHDLNKNDIENLLNKKSKLTTLYNCFYLMFISLSRNKTGQYMSVYLQLESTGVFNSHFESKVLDNLNQINNSLDLINGKLEIVNKNLSEINNYLDILNNQVYKLNLGIDDVNLNLNDISSSILEGNNILKSQSSLLNSINTGVEINNLLTGINSYQLYKINKNTKSLRG